MLLLAKWKFALCVRAGPRAGPPAACGIAALQYSLDTSPKETEESHVGIRRVLRLYI